MTIDEAIDILSDNHTVLYSHGDYTEQEEIKTQSMAIKSLEAWEKIKTEIAESKIDNDLDFGNEMYYNNAINDVLQIIDKHLSEVSECR